MFERFTDRARKTMALANQIALQHNQDYIRREHILAGMLLEGSGVGIAALKALNPDHPQNIFEALREKMKKGPIEQDPLAKLPQTPGVKTVISDAIAEARELHHNYVGTEHLLLGLAKIKEGTVFEVFSQFGITYDAARKEVVTLLEDVVEVDHVGELPKPGNVAEAEAAQTAVQQNLLVTLNSQLGQRGAVSSVDFLVTGYKMLKPAEREQFKQRIAGMDTDKNVDQSDDTSVPITAT